MNAEFNHPFFLESLEMKMEPPVHETTRGFSFGPVRGLVIVGLALLMAGCAGGEQKKDQPKVEVPPPTLAPTEPSEEKLAQEKIELLTKQLGHFKAIQDSATFQQEWVAIQALDAELTKNQKALLALPEDRRVAAEKIFVAPSQQLTKLIAVERKRAIAIGKPQFGPPKVPNPKEAPGK